MPRLIWIFGLAILLASSFLAARLFGARTQLEIERDKIEIAWAKVERDLVRRVDLLPHWLGIVDSLKEGPLPGVSSDKVARARSALAAVSRVDGRAELIEAHRRLESEVAALQSELHNHPIRRRSEEFLRIEDQILAIENRIDLDRTEYNDAVQHFNTRLALFPGNLAANVFGIRRYGVYVPTDSRSASMATSFTETAAPATN